METDLHMHSNCSDGVLSPAELACFCAGRGVKNCALTDHDTIKGIPEFIQKCTELKINAISGIEFSAEFESELHILGYGFDLKNSDIIEQTERLRKEREIRVLKYINKLKNQGVKISLEEVMDEAGDASLGRPHIAAVLQKKGYINNMKDAFVSYLKEDKMFSRKKMSPESIIELIKGAGGTAVIAHPKLIGTNVETLVKRLKQCGLGGLEAYYPMHNDSEKDYFETLAIDNGLMVTVGSDYHREFYGALPGFEMRSSEYLQESIKFLFGRGQV